ncbi:transcriptional regulator [Porphyromonas gingivalis]|uniref:Repressor n=2 Tax=Dewhirstvirus TaxID=3425072 RepID=A0AAT9JBT8_9CAUD|nr:helix-turn-helix domain-containing protein [Porphyromonas gingivalis]EOA11240.1 DNA-binding helix-turn-helix protein [Porphyromonas gingivalis JCVI SC001]PDP57537.1 transcriptional regulator [Porphyromonas gingivalis]
MDLEKQVIKNIFEIVRIKGFKEQVIAEAIELDKTAVSKIKSGKKALRISMLPAIATALEVSVVDLITYPTKYAEEICTRTLEEQVSVTFHVPLSRRKELLAMIVPPTEEKATLNP